MLARPCACSRESVRIDMTLFEHGKERLAQSAMERHSLAPRTPSKTLLFECNTPLVLETDSYIHLCMPVSLIHTVSFIPMHSIPASHHAPLICRSHSSSSRLSLSSLSPLPSSFLFPFFLSFLSQLEPCTSDAGGCKSSRAW